MPGFVLDTCVLSEIRRLDGNRNVKEAVGGLPENEIFVSVISLGELRKGISLLATGRRRSELEPWLANLEQELGAQLLPIDSQTARLWGERTSAAARRGQPVATADGLIAASAIHRRLTVMTRNIRDFEPMDVNLFDPWHGPTS